MDIVNLEKKYIMQTYKRYEVCFVRGRGQYLWDDKGKKYLDFFAGLSVCNLGHCHPKIIKSVHNQVDKLIHTSNLYYHKQQIELAELIIKRSFRNGKVFYSNSGAEANECAIKLARKYGNLTKNGSEIIVFNNSFHGRTIATLTATGQKKFHDGFQPLVPGFKYAEFNNIESVKKLINKKTSAIMIEPIQGEGGIIPAEKEFLVELRTLCNKHNLILIYDEVQCGLGRTGELFAYQYYNVEPDIFTLSKSIANGLPLGVTVVKKKYSELFNRGDHGSTFGGNIVSCSAAIEVIKLLNKKYLDKIKIKSGYLINKLIELKSRHKIIKEVRGVGFMLGMELNISGTDIVKECLKHGLVINCTQDRVLRFLPPFVITRSDIDKAISILDTTLNKLQNH